MAPLDSPLLILQHCSAVGNTSDSRTASCRVDSRNRDDPPSSRNFQELQSSGSQEETISRELLKGASTFLSSVTHGHIQLRLPWLLRPDSCGVVNPIRRIVETNGRSPHCPSANRDPLPGEVGRAICIRDADLYEMVEDLGVGARI